VTQLRRGATVVVSAAAGVDGQWAYAEWRGG